MSTTDLQLAPLNHLQTLIASSAAFRTEVGAANVAAAKARIYKGEKLGELTESRAIIGAYPGRVWRKRGTAHWEFEGSGLFVNFEFLETANRSDPNAAHDSFIAKIEDILNEITALCGTDDGTTQYLDVVEITEAIPAMPCDPDQHQGVYFWGVEYRFVHRG
jgi:hypothetical protein